MPVPVAPRAFYLANVILALAILAYTKWVPESQLLARVSIENGPYEVATAAILLLGAIWLAFGTLRTTQAPGLVRIAALGMAALCFVGAGEEVSWGQHWLGYDSGAFFSEYNHQQETNLHNLIPAVAFSTAINVVIYAWFTLLPGIHWAFPQNPVSRLLTRWHLARWIPSLDIALMMLLASCFHAWLLPAAYSDTAVLIASWLVLGILMIWQGQVRSDQWFMWLLCGSSFALCIWVADIFRHHNMQYEIRECFTAYIIVVWALCWAGRSANRDAS